LAGTLEPGFAGSFYPGNPAALRESVARLTGPFEPVRGAVGMVVPHAGFQYSGVTAGRGYAAAPDDPGLVIICAPSHRFHVRGAVIPDVDAFGTPLGPVEVDVETAGRIRRMGVGSGVFQEHSLEVQLPFVRHRWPGIRILPVVTVSDDPGFQRELAATLFRETGGAFFVASSDLSHYHALGEAVKLDALVRDAFVSLSPQRLSSALAQGGEACGAPGIAVLMHYAALAGANRGIEVHYSTSADAGAGESRVVGYFSGLAVREEATDGQP
jgi:AmmeMemoRadiSam system protein B